MISMNPQQARIHAGRRWRGSLSDACSTSTAGSLKADPAEPHQRKRLLRWGHSHRAATRSSLPRPGLLHRPSGSGQIPQSSTVSGAPSNAVPFELDRAWLSGRPFDAPHPLHPAGAGRRLRRVGSRKREKVAANWPRLRGEGGALSPPKAPVRGGRLGEPALPGGGWWVGGRNRWPERWQGQRPGQPPEREQRRPQGRRSHLRGIGRSIGGRTSRCKLNATLPCPADCSTTTTTSSASTGVGSSRPSSSAT